MEKRSTKTLDLNTWIKKVIRSCETIQQLHIRLQVVLIRLLKKVMLLKYRTELKQLR